MRATQAIAQVKDKAKVNKLKQQQQSIETEAQKIRRKKQEKQQKARYHESKLVRKQRELYRTRSKLTQQQLFLAGTRSELVRLETELDKTVGEKTRLESTAAQRLRSLYMGERISFLQLMLEADNLSSLLDRLFYKQKVVNHDQALLTELREKTELLTEKKAALKAEQAVEARQFREIQNLNNNIIKQVREQNALTQRYKNDAAYYERLERQMLAESGKIQQQLQSLGAVSVASSTGKFLWPITGRITSPFGYRRHPIRGRRLLHTGLDIARPNGYPIKAADGGTIVFSGWRGGYGQAIIINHGKRGSKNLASLYGHMSSRSVSKGQTVRKGQVIGKVGSTGHSTGPHLHFEIRENGVPVNPKKYLP